MRWNEDKSRRFQLLRQAEDKGELSHIEQAELEGLLAELDADEADALGSAKARMDERATGMSAEKARLDAEAVELERIALEHERLLLDARGYLEALKRRSAALAEDFRRATGREPAPIR